MEAHSMGDAENHVSGHGPSKLSNHSSVEEIFNKHAERYDSWYDRNLPILRAEKDCIKLLAPHGLVLDIGVGTARLTYDLSVRLVGVDPSFGMLRKAVKRNILAVQALGEELPFRDNMFDTVLTIVTICFADNPAALISEAKRVLKPGGRLITCFVPRESPWGRHYWWLGISGRSVFYRKARFYSVSEVEELIINAGLRICDYCSTLSYPPIIPPIYDTPIRSRDPSYGFICICAEKII